MMTEAEYNEFRAQGKTPEAIAVIGWTRRLEFLDTPAGQKITNGSVFRAEKISFYPGSKCPLCIFYKGHCDECSLPKVDNGLRCCDDNSLFDQANYAPDRKHLIIAILQMVDKLREADELMNVIDKAIKEGIDGAGC